ncbi:SRPBCC family protein [Smaragdicoccus niigatensis]|uniref:SRPBCC family protein n=1 Tax=Smaragdicoccus niigatensis TaxID=359359 RepID=UPI00037B70BD|nr:SRPBCC family protein [Smaragdicoccus niigatensis]
MTAPGATGSITINASADQVYDLVSNPKKIVEFAEETFKILTVNKNHWVGFNRNGWHVWATHTKIVQAVPGRVFEFEIGELGVPVARWQYTIEPADGGVQVTESWWDRRPAWFTKVAAPFTGVKERVPHNTVNIAETLRKLKVIAEG